MRLQFLLYVVGSWVYCVVFILAVDSQVVIPQTGENTVTQDLAMISTIKKISAFIGDQPC